MPVAGVPPKPIQGIGGGPRAEGEGLKAEGRRRTGANAELGGRGSGRAMSRDGENDSFAFGASLLGFIELGP